MLTSMLYNYCEHHKVCEIPLIPKITCTSIYSVLSTNIKEMRRPATDEKKKIRKCDRLYFFKGIC